MKLDEKELKSVKTLEQKKKEEFRCQKRKDNFFTFLHFLNKIIESKNFQQRDNFILKQT